MMSGCKLYGKSFKRRIICLVVGISVVVMVLAVMLVLVLVSEPGVALRCRSESGVPTDRVPVVMIAAETDASCLEVYRDRSG